MDDGVEHSLGETWKIVVRAVVPWTAQAAGGDGNLRPEPERPPTARSAGRHRPSQ